mmetsp:Transcript_21514/g.59595  ORF Transcript_21514/g.59595 Transcript_21514/m.59595 type:complete len:286 (+) Transcript_21514:562-1419(+)
MAADTPFAIGSGPLYFSLHTPFVISSTSTLPPILVMAPRSMFKCMSTFSTVADVTSILSTCTTSLSASPNAALSARSMPIFIVAPEDAHVPQAPWSLRETTPSSTFTTSTSPPSSIKYGRTSLSAWSAASSVKAFVAPWVFSPTVRCTLARAKGDAMGCPPAVVEAASPVAVLLAAAEEVGGSGGGVGPPTASVVCLSMTSDQSPPSIAFMVFSLRCFVSSSPVAGRSSNKTSPMARLSLAALSACSSASASVILRPLEYAPVPSHMSRSGPLPGGTAPSLPNSS